MRQRSALFLWFLISWGLIVATRYPALNQLVLKGLIPVIFVCLIIFEQRFYLNNKALNCYIGFFVWCVLSLLYTVNTSMTLGYLQSILGNIIIWYSAYRLSSYIKDTKLALFILGSAFFYHAVLGLITPIEIMGSAGYGRASGVFANSNALGFSMWYGIVIFIFFLLESDSKVLKVVFLLSIIVCLWVLLSSGSRKNALAFLVFISVLVWYLLKGRFRWGILVIILFSVIGYDSVSNFILEETVVGARLQADALERGAGHRSELLWEGLSFFLQYPLLGIGLGSFTSYSSSGLMSHNDYVEILSSTGLVGFLLYMPIFWYFFKHSGQLLHFKHTYKFGIVTRGFLVGYVFLGMGRPAFLDPVAILVFGFFYSVCLKHLSVIAAIGYSTIQNKTYEDLSDHQHA